MILDQYAISQDTGCGLPSTSSIIEFPMPDKKVSLALILLKLSHYRHALAFNKGIQLLRVHFFCFEALLFT